jgi:hypothetical protein
LSTPAFGNVLNRSRLFLLQITRQQCDQRAVATDRNSTKSPRNNSQRRTFANLEDFLTVVK